MNSQKICTTTHIVIALACFVSFNGSAKAQNRSDVGYNEPNPRRQHLRFIYNLGNVKYRRQVLSMTPIGSKYKQVAEFLLGEIFYLTKGERSWNVDNAIKLRAGPALIIPQAFQMQPPFTRMTKQLNSGYVAVGAKSVDANIGMPPPFVGRQHVLRIVYAFDAKDRVVDVFCLEVTTGTFL